jgi:RNA polymerase sigma-70 factor (ECF subfamily)
MGLWPFTVNAASPFEATAANELERRIERALANLPAASREVLLLVGVSGLDQSEVADICGITPSALRQRLHRAREMLAHALERDAIGPSVLEGVPSCPTR